MISLVLIIAILFISWLPENAAFVQHSCFRPRANVGLNLKDENMTPEERAVALEKATKAMTAFSNT